MASLYTPVKFTNERTTPLQQAIYTALKTNNFHGYISKDQADTLRTEFNLTAEELYFAMLPFATCYAFPTVSNFFVGAIVECIDGNFYFGANMELEGVNIQYTVHAEQCAINHAYLSGAKGIKSIIVNYSPCGHCRQFINEVNTAQELKIYLPQIPQGAPLSYYLPDSFGPNDLGVTQRLFDQKLSPSYFVNSQLETVLDTVTADLNNCYSPYSKSPALVVIQSENNNYYVGRYIENAAFNPSFAAIISALALARVYNEDGTKFKLLHVIEATNTTFSIAQLVRNIGTIYQIPHQIQTVA